MSCLKKEHQDKQNIIEKPLDTVTGCLHSHSQTAFYFTKSQYYINTV